MASIGINVLGWYEMSVLASLADMGPYAKGLVENASTSAGSGSAMSRSNEGGAWVRNALDVLSREEGSTPETPLYRLTVPRLRGIEIYLKDESEQPTGSLKHRLARSLFLHAICSGRIRKGTPVVEASSGSTAVSEAYFARLLGLPFTAVMPRSTAPEKVRLVEAYGGHCHFTDSAVEIYGEAQRLAQANNGHYMDQFTFAEQVSDWRNERNIAAEIFRQMSEQVHCLPAALVMGAGTGGTSATMGRYIRYRGYETQLLVVDPENSVFFDAYQCQGTIADGRAGSRIEGIGRPRLEPSFVPGAIDSMIKVPDAASVAAMRWLQRLTGKMAGASTGTNLWGALQLAAAMQARGERGAIVTVICDRGDRYRDSYYDDDWVAAHIGDTMLPAQQLAALTGSPLESLKEVSK